MVGFVKDAKGLRKAMHKVALLKTSETETYNSYGDCDYRTIADYLTDFVEVSDEEFKLLHDNRFNGRYIVVEKPESQREFVGLKIQEYLDRLNTTEKKRLAELDRRKQTLAKTAKEREAKKAAKELKQLEELKKKYENNMK